MKTIQYSAFLGCTRLESVYVDSIDFWFNVDFLDTYSNPFGYANYLYVNGELLETLVIPEGITEIKYTAFAGCDSITSIVFSSTVTKIANAAFKDCSSLQQVVIPNTVTEIGTSVFANCESLESVTLPEGLTYIPANTFVACTSLYELNVGAAIENIDTTAFLACLSLSKITVAEGNANYASMDGILYNKALDQILFIPHAIDGKITISSGITSIPAEFFANYPELDELVIPESVTSIGKDAFKGCTSLKAITLPFIGESADSSNKFSFVFGTVPASLEKVVITKATVIKDEEFAECSGIKEIHLPEGVTTIGNSAFKNCYGLTSIIIPASVTEIKDGAFEGCIKLSSVYYGSTAEAYKNLTVGANNVPFNNARKYYYNTTVVEEAAEGSFWYLNDKGAIVIW